MPNVSFFVPGTPKSQGSKRALPTKTGKTVMVEQVKGVKDWRADVRAAAQTAWSNSPISKSKALSVTMLFTFIRPTSVSVRKRPLPNVRPDVEKLARAVADALTGLIYTDDSQVVDLHISKRYGARPGVWIDVTTLEGFDD